MMSKKLLYLLVFFYIVVLVFSFTHLQKKIDLDDYTCRDCNLILISIDTLRSDHLGAYGYFRDTSPVFDELARKSLFFPDVTTVSSHTLASHMSLFTSLYPKHHGVYLDRHRLSDETLTLADILHFNGYKTVAYTGGGYVRKRYNYHTFDAYNDSGRVYGDYVGENFDGMLDWVTDNEESPFFLFWHTYRTHCPYEPDEEYDIFSDENFSGVVEPRNTVEPWMKSEDRKANLKCWEYYKEILPDMGSADFDYVRAMYDAEILMVDERLGMLLDLLEEKNLSENTVIVFTSDHGESLADREKYKKIGHHLLFDEVIHVPLAIKVPGVSRQRIFDKPIESIDVMPTLLDILGFEKPSNIDGESVFDINDFGFRSEYIISENLRSNSSFSGGPEHVIRKNNFKLFYYPNWEKYELYKIDDDPKEVVDVLVEYPKVVADLKRNLHSYLEGADVVSSESDLDDETIEQLRSLGYIQ